MLWIDLYSWNNAPNVQPLASSTNMSVLCSHWSRAEPHICASLLSFFDITFPAASSCFTFAVPGSRELNPMLTLKHTWLFSNLLLWHAILYGLCSFYLGIYPGQRPSQPKLVSSVLPDLPHSSTTVSVIGKNWALVETTGLKIPILPLTVWLKKLLSLSLASIAIK